MLEYYYSAENEDRSFSGMEDEEGEWIPYPCLLEDSQRELDRAYYECMIVPAVAAARRELRSALAQYDIDIASALVEAICPEIDFYAWCDWLGKPAIKDLWASGKPDLTRAKAEIETVNVPFFYEF